MSAEVQNKGPAERKDYHIRITSRDDLPDKLLELFKEPTLIVREKEDTDEQHYHLCVEGVKPSTVRERLKKYYKGNKQFSIREWKDPLQLQYLCKGESEDELPKIILNSIGCDVEDLHQKFWTDRKDYERRVIERKKSSKDFKERLLERCRQEGHVKTYLIMRTMWGLCKEENKMPPGDYLAISYIEYVQCQLDDGGAALSLKTNRILEKMTPRNLL